MNDHDLRQLEAMQSQIRAFRQGSIDLAWLVSSLESLRHALQDVSPDWIDRFWSMWGVLEEIHSVSVVRERPVPPADRMEILRVIGEIDAMIAELIAPLSET